MEKLVGERYGTEPGPPAIHCIVPLFLMVFVESWLWETGRLFKLIETGDFFLLK